ncbi:LysR family transcriptional regulator [Alteromonas sp. KUL49]|uniref:LysR family transcriptional regulator n=1 Tax=Alteromonas sp. KUL49 TaxID=2480798 RepID=UPI00102EF861|nr:LysR family transcriptional regulator [Alteromonas sp. KUL49]TAP41250.1 LysR family transcriptional regulator [Alteromonas sp. KUL49]
MNIDHLKLFVRVAYTKNISAAGREMHLSPAVSSAYISKLEADVGVRLIHRTTRQVGLTDDGKQFLPHAESILNTVETAQASVGNGKQIPKGTLRITAPASFGRMHIIPAIKQFLDDYPQIKIDFRFSDSILDVVEGGYDIAIRDAALKDSSLHARKIAPDHRILVAAPSYIERHGEPDTIEALEQHQAVALSGLRTWEFETDKGVASIRPKVNLSVDNGEAVRDACIHGNGITIMSTWCCYEALMKGQLVQVLPSARLFPTCDLWAVYPSQRLLAPKVRVFIDFLASHFGQTPYWDEALAKHTSN